MPSSAPAVVRTAALHRSSAAHSFTCHCPSGFQRYCGPGTAPSSLGYQRRYGAQPKHSRPRLSLLSAYQKDRRCRASMYRFCACSIIGRALLRRSTSVLVAGKDFSIRAFTCRQGRRMKGPQFNRLGRTMIGYIDPTRQAFAEFCGNNPEGPIHMLNLVRLREQARYPDGRLTTGAEALCRLRSRERPVFSRLGAKIIWAN
jgi:hypothetical protein